MSTVSQEVKPAATKISDAVENPQTPQPDENGRPKSRKSIFNQITTFFQKIRKPKKTRDPSLKEKKTSKSESVENDSVTKPTSSAASTPTTKTEQVPCKMFTSDEENVVTVEVKPSQTVMVDSKPSMKTAEPRPSVEESLVECETIKTSEKKLGEQETQTSTIPHEEEIEEKAPAENDVSDETVEPSVTSSDKNSLSSVEVNTETKKEESSDDEPGVENTAEPEQSDIKTDEPPTEVKEESSDDEPSVENTAEPEPSDIKTDEPPTEVKEEETLSPKIISESTDGV